MSTTRGTPIQETSREYRWTYTRVPSSSSAAYAKPRKTLSKSPSNRNMIIQVGTQLFSCIRSQIDSTAIRFALLLLYQHATGGKINWSAIREPQLRNRADINGFARVTPDASEATPAPVAGWQSGKSLDALIARWIDHASSRKGSLCSLYMLRSSLGATRLRVCTADIHYRSSVRDSR